MTVEEYVALNPSSTDDNEYGRGPSWRRRVTVATADTKTCRGCFRKLPANEFNLVRSDRPWLRSKCRECTTEQRRALRHRHQEVRA